MSEPSTEVGIDARVNRVIVNRFMALPRGVGNLSANVHDHAVRAVEQPLPNGSSRTRVHRVVRRIVPKRMKGRQSWATSDRLLTSHAVQTKALQLGVQRTSAASLDDVAAVKFVTGFPRIGLIARIAGVFGRVETAFDSIAVSEICVHADWTGAFSRLAEMSRTTKATPLRQHAAVERTNHEPGFVRASFLSHTTNACDHRGPSG